MSRTPVKLLAAASPKRRQRGSVTPQWLAAAINERTGHVLSLRMFAADGVTLIEERAIICAGGFVEAWNFRGACTQWPVDAFVRRHFAAHTDTSDDDVVRAILGTAEIYHPCDFPAPPQSHAKPAVMPAPQMPSKECYDDDDDDFVVDDEAGENALAEPEMLGITFTSTTPPIVHALAAAKVYEWLRSTAISPSSLRPQDDDFAICNGELSE